MKNYTSYALTLLGAVIYHLGHPNHFDFLFPLGPIIGMSILLFQILPKQSLKSRILKYLSFNLVITLVSFYWITKTLQEFGDLPFLIALGANSLYTLIFQPHLWLIIIGISFLERRRELKLDSNMGIFSLAVALTITEYFIPQQFPVFLSHPLITWSEYLGLASIFGMPMFSFISYLIALELARFVKLRKYSSFHIVLVILFIGLNPILKIDKQPLAKAQKTNFNVRMVQPNISNFLKVKSEEGGFASVSYVLDQYKEQSIKKFKFEEQIDLIIWPETAYPYPIDSNKINIEQTMLPPIIDEISTQTKAELLIGGYDQSKEPEDTSYYMTDYNAAFFIDREGILRDTYHKHILIPFGETLPFGPLNKTIGSYIQNISFFAEGEKFPVFKTEKNINLITTICYELLRPEFIREYLNNLETHPHMIVNLTNDSWYGNTLEPEQHLFLARWRAIELNLPILRSTNTGITTLISSNGQEVQRLEYDVKGALDLSIPLSELKHKENYSTLFQRYGIFLSFAIWILCFIFHYMLLKFKYVKNS